MRSLQQRDDAGIDVKQPVKDDELRWAASYDSTHAKIAPTATRRPRISEVPYCDLFDELAGR